MKTDLNPDIMKKIKYPFQDTSLSFERRTEDIISHLTIEEKISQMVHESPAIERLEIPAYNWLNEGLHGVARAGIATVFPQAIGLAATFDTDLIHRVATAISDEARAKHHAHASKGDRTCYTGLTYWSPNINIFRDPRWGRGQETYGECPYLTSRMAVEFVKGMQGEDPEYLKLAATPKHFAAHSGPDGKRRFFNAKVGKKDLHETYLPAFRACVTEAKAESVMGAYNRLNGELCCAGRTLLNDLLREEWGFKGYVVSDYGAIKFFHEYHKVTSNPEKSCAIAVKNGCDLNCGCSFLHLVEAVKHGLITEKDIDIALRRLFLARFKLGMFDPPEKVKYAQIPYERLDCDEHRQLSLEAAQKSIVLLKNDGILPLSKDVKKIAVIGPNADNTEALWGNYHGISSKTVTPLEGIRNKVSQNTKVLYAPGSEIFYCGNDDPERQDVIIKWGKSLKDRTEAVLAAERADVVLLCLGLSSRFEGEAGDTEIAESGGDRKEIGLTGSQQKLLEEIYKTGKPVILVIISGSMTGLCWAHNNTNAIIQQFYPGQEGGTALADVLFGDYNPSGRLPVTFYKTIRDLPDFEDYNMKGRTYRYFEGEPLYTFGFGLSYTQFEYSNLCIPASAQTGQDINVSVDVQNIGPEKGDEVIQLYLSRPEKDTKTPIRQLVGFERVTIKPGEKQTINFTLKPRQVAVVNDQGSYIILPGTVEISAGGSQPDSLSRKLGAPRCIVKSFKLVGSQKTLPR